MDWLVLGACEGEIEGIGRVVMWASVLNRGSSAMMVLWTYCRQRWRWPNS